MNNIIGNKGIAIIFVSIVIQTLVLPLYKQADSLQEEELEKQKNMSKYVSHIKKSFTGDERYMMLQTYYREQNYKVWYPLKSSISLFLQIPFFSAAYSFLSHLEELKGVPFLFIKDLSLPDSAIVIGSITINMLPIAMTVFNLISGAIYTKGHPLKSKIQGWVLALVFLVLLYRSPSGLVLYWTCNNIYSLLKNLFMKMISRAEFVISLVVLVASMGFSYFLHMQGKLTYTGIAIILIVVVLACVPMLKKIYFFKGKHDTGVGVILEKYDLKFMNSLVFAATLMMSIVAGMMIPLAVISASATEFIVADRNPLYIVLNSVVTYAGFFVIWIPIFYCLMTEKNKRIMGVLFPSIAVVAVLNYLVYGNKRGLMTAYLKYEQGLSFGMKENIACLLLDAILLLIAILLYLKLPKIFRGMLLVVSLCCVILSTTYVTKINKDVREFEASKENNATENIITLSKNGNNVVVIMLDRAAGLYLPYILQEKPEYKDALDGFVFYPNTLSYGNCTNYGAPALFGGYEYTPEEMDKRDTEKLGDKHDEALKMMPKLFSDNGYNVVVCDPPYAGYKGHVSDLSIYDDIDNVKAYITEGCFNEKVGGEENLEVQNRCFIYYSLSKLLPTILQEVLYNNGTYCSTLRASDIIDDDFTDQYYALAGLNIMTNISDDESNNLLIFQNATAHEPIILRTPEYVRDTSVDVEEEMKKNPYMELDGVVLDNSEEWYLAHYHVCVAAVKLVVKYLEYLDENDVYDNTRIIIVADHGTQSAVQFEDYYFDEGKNTNVQSYNPLLLYKDFDSREKLNIDKRFMTNADTPLLAVEGLISDARNPYTGKKITNRDKFEHPQYVSTSNYWDITRNNGYTYDTQGAPWYSVHDNIFDMGDWQKVQDP